jgi:hypothetical protein
MKNVRMDFSCQSTSGRLGSLLLFAALLMVGCSRSGIERYEVSGNVTYAGEKVAEGAISFVPIGETRGPHVGGGIQQGHYRIHRSHGPVAGRYRVEIVSARKTGQKVKNMAGLPIDQVVNGIPAKYSGTTSELAVVIKPQGENVFDFDLK